MKLTKTIIIGVLGAFLFTSCSKEEDGITEQPAPEGDYANGFFVTNEGSQSAGTVTYISNELEEVEQEIFTTVNAGDDLGNYVQSMFFTEDLAFIISNGSNLITVVDRYTFELKGKVDSGLQAPRYGVVVGGKAYVTNHAGWDSNTDDYIAIIDVKSLEVEDTVVVGDYAEDITEENGKLYIQNSAYGSGRGVTVFNPANNAVDRQVGTGEKLNSIEVEGNTLYALSPGKLETIDLTKDQVVSEIIFAEGSGSAGNLELEGDNLYYTIGNKVYAVNVGSTTPASEPIVAYTSNSDWGVMYGFKVEDGRIFIADGGDFASNSFVEVYTVEGEFLERIEVGVGPNSFYFN